MIHQCYAWGGKKKIIFCVLRLWHTACPGKDSDVIVFGGSCDYILLVDTVSTNNAKIVVASVKSVMDSYLCSLYFCHFVGRISNIFQQCWLKANCHLKKNVLMIIFFFQALQKMVSVKWNVLWDSDSIGYGWVISRGYDAFEFLVAVIHTYE